MPKARSKNVFLFNYILVFIATLINTNITAQQFSKEDILSDLDYLKSSLENVHFSLYANTTKESFNQNFVEVRNQVKKDSFSILEVTNLFQRVVAKSNNAHTRILYPVKSYLNFAQSGGVVFPLEVSIENGKVLVRKNWSTNSSIKLGAELSSINGISINKVLNKIYPQISGERLYIKNSQLELFSLPRYYWLVFGEQKEFQVEIVQNSSLSVQRLLAIKAIDDYEMKRDDIQKNYSSLKYYPNTTAYLLPGPFGGDLNKFKQYIDSSFVDINAKKIENLIIDLRDNGGGNEPFSDYLISYIADKPFKWSSKFELKTSAILKESVRKNQDTTKAYWKSILTHKNGTTYEYDFGFYEPKPQKKRFQGNVYVLVNRQSFSQSAVTAALVQDYGFGLIVGEETAEYPTLYASIFNYSLPKTGITVGVSKGKITRINGIEDNKGVIPDIVIEDHLLDDKDEILEGLLKKIN